MLGYQNSLDEPSHQNSEFFGELLNFVVYCSPLQIIFLTDFVSSHRAENMELHRTRAVAQRQQEVCHLLFQPIVIARGLIESYAKNNTLIVTCVILGTYG